MILQHRCLVLAAIFLASCHRAADGFLVPRHPSGLTKPAVSTRFGNKHFVQLHSSASPSIDAFANNTTLPEPKAKKASREKTYSYKIEEAGRTRTTTYPWSEIQQWALRDNLPRYTIRIPTPEDSDSDNDNDTLTLASFALWRSLQRDVPELAGYPIGFLRARYEEEDSRKEKPGADDSSGAPCAETTPGVLPYLQNYEFATGGGISGDVYGLQGVSDGTRITTPPLEGIEESLPRGYAQTTDGKASYELGLPLASSGAEPQLSSGVAGAAAAAADGLADRGLRELRSLATATTSLEDNDLNGDGMLVRLGALSGVLLAGATAINMLSHHLTVNVFWV